MDADPKFDWFRPTDWGDATQRPMNEFGSKAEVREAKSAYSTWRRTIGHECYANDVDFIEWRRGPHGVWRPVAVIESSHYQDAITSSRYLDNVLARFNRDGQGTVTRGVAEALKVPAYIVLARQDCGEFYVHGLRNSVWHPKIPEPAYRRWVMRLGG